MYSERNVDAKRGRPSDEERPLNIDLRRPDSEGYFSSRDSRFTNCWRLPFACGSFS